MMDKKLKFGIIGCSSISERSTIPAIQKSNFAELKMIGSRSETKAKEFANRFGCSNFGSYENIIDDDDIDAVYISTPIGTHEEWVTKAAKVGKHVLCEKSSTVSFKSAKKMVDTCINNKGNQGGVVRPISCRDRTAHSTITKGIPKVN